MHSLRASGVQVAIRDEVGHIVQVVTKQKDKDAARDKGIYGQLTTAEAI